jgi:tRNA splicing endonuclease
LSHAYRDFNCGARDDDKTLIKRIKDMGLKPEDYDWYLDLRRFGTVPHVGFGMGWNFDVDAGFGEHNRFDSVYKDNEEILPVEIQVFLEPLPTHKRRFNSHLPEKCY